MSVRWGGAARLRPQRLPVPEPYTCVHCDRQYFSHNVPSICPSCKTVNDDQHVPRKSKLVQLELENMPPVER